MNFFKSRKVILKSCETQFKKCDLSAVERLKKCDLSAVGMVENVKLSAAEAIFGRISCLF